MARRPNGKADRLQRAYERGLNMRGVPGARCPYAVEEHAEAWRRGQQDPMTFISPAPPAPLKEETSNV